MPRSGVDWYSRGLGLVATMMVVVIVITSRFLSLSGTQHIKTKPDIRELNGNEAARKSERTKSREVPFDDTSNVTLSQSGTQHVKRESHILVLNGSEAARKSERKQSRKVSWHRLLVARNGRVHIELPAGKNFTSVEEEMGWVKETLFRRGPKRKRLPDVLVLGVKKCASATLNNFLSVNPFLQGRLNKEFFFFNSREIYEEKGVDWFRSEMSPAAARQLVYSTSSCYFQSAHAPERVFRTIPDVRMLVTVCDPVTRLVSEYVHNAARGREEKNHTFEHFYFNTTSGGVSNTSYDNLRIGFHAQHLRKWQKYFLPAQIMFIDSVKFKLDPVSVLQDIEDFLRIPKYVDSRHFTKGPKGYFCMNRTGGCMGESKGRKHPKVPEAVLRALYNFYRPMNEEFFTITNRSFDWEMKL